jgi:hypothetical protein
MTKDKSKPSLPFLFSPLSPSPGGPVTRYGVGYERSFHPLSFTPGTTAAESGRFQPGTFVAFQLDTAYLKKCVEPEYWKALREASPARPIGMVTSSFVYPLRSQYPLVEELTIHFTSCTKHEHLQPVAEFQMPINTTSNNRPGQRTPLEVDGYLPPIPIWQCTTLSIRAIVTCVHDAPADSQCHLKNKMEFQRWEQAAVQDYDVLPAKLECLIPLDTNRTWQQVEGQRQCIKSLGVTGHPLPVQIWKNVSAGNLTANPIEFGISVHRLHKFVNFLYRWLSSTDHPFLSVFCDGRCRR